VESDEFRDRYARASWGLAISSPLRALPRGLCKVAPKKYGDRLLNEHSGPDGKPIQTQSVTPQTPDQVRNDLRDIFGAAGGLAAARINHGDLATH
jgi:hypothetical protein